MGNAYFNYLNWSKWQHFTIFHLIYDEGIFGSPLWKSGSACIKNYAFFTQQKHSHKKVHFIYQTSRPPLMLGNFELPAFEWTFSDLAFEKPVIIKKEVFHTLIGVKYFLEKYKNKHFSVKPIKTMHFTIKLGRSFECSSVTFFKFLSSFIIIYI